MSSRGSKKKVASYERRTEYVAEREKAHKQHAREIWWGKYKTAVIVAIMVFVALGIIIGVTVSTSSGGAGGPSTGKYTLMDLGSQGCIPCDNLQPVLNSLRSKYSGKIDVKFYDVNRTSQGAQLANKYGVSTIPTLIFLDKNGNVVKRLVGYHSQAELESEFRSLGWI